MQVNADREEGFQEGIRPWESRELVAEYLRCPYCGQIRKDHITWLAVDKLHCSGCDHEYMVWIDRSESFQIDLRCQQTARGQECVAWVDRSD